MAQKPEEEAREEIDRLLAEDGWAAAERERLNQKKDELRRMVRPNAECSAVAKDCLLQSNIR